MYKSRRAQCPPRQRVMGYRWPGYYFAIRNEPICRYPRPRLASYEYFFDGWTFDWSCPSPLLCSTKFQSVSRLFHASILVRYSNIFAGQLTRHLCETLFFPIAVPVTTVLVPHGSASFFLLRVHFRSCYRTHGARDKSKMIARMIRSE